ncbi:MAG: radical SAM protein [Solobacterium sp.]|nr:radical SAM protein [Solobacterium sp.]
MALRNISVMIKPASSLCNLRCRYCFYADISENRTVASNGIMQEETTDCILSRINEALNGKGTANISFQGGEPTVAGLDYFRHFTEEMKKYSGIIVNYALQTNGTLITEEWAQFFHEHNFLIGVSLDGYKLNMDKFRFDAENNSVFDRIMKTVKLLRKYKVEFNILTVVTDDLASHAKALLKFYRDNQFQYVQLIPCLPGFSESTDVFALTPEKYASFYIEFFDAWLREYKRGNPISVNLFENLYGMAHGEMPYQCGMLGRCTVQYVIESNGDTYPCDFYCLDEYMLGNLHESSFAQLRDTGNAEKFLAGSACRRKPCDTCPYIRICNGGCRRQNVCYLTDEYCAYQKVLDHILPVLSRM